MAFLLRLSGNVSKLLKSNLGTTWFTLLKSTKIDAIDSFTTELVEKKALKWELLKDNTTTLKHCSGITIVIKSILAELDSIRKPELCVDIRNLSSAQLDNLLFAIIEIKNEEDFVFIIKQCIDRERLPSNKILLESLKYLSEIPSVNLLDKIALTCELKNENVFKNYANLKPFQGLAHWKMGNFTTAFKILKNCYNHSSHEKGQKLLRETFKEIVVETFNHKSEAVLVNLLKIGEEIYKEFDEVFALGCIWKNAFCSKWFSDQNMSIEIFEKYLPLQSLVSQRSTALCYTFLREHNVEAVHRLIELFLKVNDKTGCSNCLRLLFDYQYWCKDLRACSEIVQYSLDLDLPLSEVQNQKLLNLLLDKPIAYYKRRTIFSHKFEYKF